MALPEEQVAPEGEYDLIIRSVTFGRTKADDRNLITIGMAIEAVDDYQMFSEYLTLPSKEDEGDKDNSPYKMFIRNMKRFLAVFGVDMADTFPSGEQESFDKEALMGETGHCLVTQSEYEGRVRNTLRLPRLAE